MGFWSKLGKFGLGAGARRLQLPSQVEHRWLRCQVFSVPQVDSLVVLAMPLLLIEAPMSLSRWSRSGCANSNSNSSSSS